ncbi:putative RmlC-like cupin family protein [Roseibium hamelinense]|uniref:Putative RmlC-like cupin family protein n=1 Tax=Roseibium hamelinense TaxID=150831 RepID=A0A562TH49_9HYPH|nr:cupin domain-containing protein [Roseibium hamelinense]MTI45851.1 cupin domain-containing protein [Roseibium hamelinense]TWI92967.1 putative RmlC-like cupin family protein [Roseibium hamelinense]
MADTFTPDKEQAGSGAPTCRVIRPNSTYAGKQGFDYLAGIASETVGSKAICMHLLEIPPGGRAKAHKHDSHETAIYMLEGTVVTYYGDHLEHRMENRAGDLIYIPANVPHLPMNLSDKPAKAVIARTDPNEQESVTLLPELEALVPE